jgi:hypothetical protein
LPTGHPPTTLRVRPSYSNVRKRIPPALRPAIGGTPPRERVPHHRARDVSRGLVTRQPLSRPPTSEAAQWRNENPLDRLANCAGDE